MKKAFLFVLGFALTTAAMAQTAPVKKEEMKDLKTDIREKKEAKHVVNNDLSHAKVGKAIKDHKAVAAENRHIRRHAKKLKARNVSHPVAKAKRQIRVQDDAKKDHTN